MTTSASAFQSQGHRGARGLAPENTLQAFSTALSIGVDVLELDVVVTADDEVVVTHNPRLEPEITRDSRGIWLVEPGPVIRSLNLTDVKRFDVGGINPKSRYARRFPDQQEYPGAEIPTLREVIGLVRASGSEKVKLNIESKLSPEDPHPTLSPDTFAKLLIDVLVSENFLSRSIIQSFNWAVLKEVHHLAPEAITSFLSAEQSWMNNLKRGEEGASDWTAGFDVDDYQGELPKLIKHAGGDIWSSYYKEVSKESIAKAHELGLRVSVWTVNEEKEMEDLIKLGVDGIITDYPDRLINVMQKLGMPLPQTY